MTAYAGYLLFYDQQRCCCYRRRFYRPPRNGAGHIFNGMALVHLSCTTKYLHVSTTICTYVPFE